MAYLMAAFESPALPSVPPLPLLSLPAQSALTLALSTHTNTHKVNQFREYSLKKTIWKKWLKMERKFRELIWLKSQDWLEQKNTVKQIPSCSSTLGHCGCTGQLPGFNLWNNCVRMWSRLLLRDSTQLCQPSGKILMKSHLPSIFYYCFFLIMSSKPVWGSWNCFHNCRDARAAGEGCECHHGNPASLNKCRRKIRPGVQRRVQYEIKDV